MSYLNTPILLITYKRHDTTFKVLKTIKKVQPKKIYIASNHWKTHKEKATILLLRKKIKEFIDWQCEVIFIKHKKYLRVQNSFYSAISTFFQSEEMGIILEDDIVPNQCFFYFCQEMLQKYKNNQEIFMVSGWSALDFDPNSKTTLKEDYYFSKYSHIWGWATWRRAWKLYKRHLVNFEENFLTLDFDTDEEKKTWHKIFSLYNQDKIDTWDYSWIYTIWKHKGLCIYPKNNMIQNIGLNRKDATNTKQWSKYNNMRTYEINLPLRHPKKLKRNIDLDKKNFIITTKIAPFWLIIINKLYRFFFKKNLKKFKQYMR